MAGRHERLTVSITEGAIRVASGEKTLTLTPIHAPPDAEGEPDFVIALDDIEAWDAPHDDALIEVEELQRIVRAVEDECDNRGLSVEFD
jgi:hypothetical protein